MILQRLRNETRKHHERVEQCFALETRLENLGTYRELLERLFAIYSVMEARLGCLDWTGTGIDFDTRRKVELLKRDLAALGLTCEKSRGIGSGADSWECGSHAEGWGCLYVLEGATLGGQVIGPIVKKRLGMDAVNGASFFASYRENAGKMWQEFCGAISAACVSEGDMTAAVGGAVRTFEFFTRELCR